MASPASPVPCNGDFSLFFGIPYLFFPNDSNQVPNQLTGKEDNHLRFWIHIGLVSFGLIIVVINFVTQLWRPLPYGKHSNADGACVVPVRPAYITVQLLSGVGFFTITYFTGSHFSSPVNISLYAIFVIHYMSRGIITPMVSRYSENRVTIWVPIQILMLNTFFHYTNAEFIGSVNYCKGYYYDPRFVVGAICFVLGFLINRAADTQVRDGNKFSEVVRSLSTPT